LANCTPPIAQRAASAKRRGLWTGGVVPLGYQVENKQLIIRPVEAVIVERIFQRYVTLRSITKVLRELDADGIRQRSGRPFDKVVLHKILKNRTYRGPTVHKTEAFPGKHEPIIDERLWNEAQSISHEPPRTRARAAAAREVALLRGLIFGPDGRAMTPQHARRRAAAIATSSRWPRLSAARTTGPSAACRRARLTMR
jgi:hypothetical protein